MNILLRRYMALWATEAMMEGLLLSCMHGFALTHECLDNYVMSVACMYSWRVEVIIAQACCRLRKNISYSCIIALINKSFTPTHACVIMPFPERGSMLRLLVDCRLPKAPLIYRTRDVSMHFACLPCMSCEAMIAIVGSWEQGTNCMHILLLFCMGSGVTHAMEYAFRLGKAKVPFCGAFFWSCTY